MSWNFNGTTAFVSVDDHANLTLAATTWTLAGWVRWPTHTGSSSQRLFTWNTPGSNNSAAMVICPDGHAVAGESSFYVRDGDGTNTGDVVSSNDHWLANTHWTHVALVRDGDVFNLYIDNVLAATKTQTSMGDTNSAANWILGWDAAQTPGKQFAGQLAHWAKWNSALTVGAGSQLAALVAGALPTAVGTPAWYVSMAPTTTPQTSQTGSLTVMLTAITAETSDPLDGGDGLLMGVE